MSDQVFRFGNFTFTGVEVALGVAAVALLVLLVVALAAWRRTARRAERSNAGSTVFDAQIARVVQAQGEISGQMQAMRDALATSNEHIRKSISDTRDTTHADLTQLNTRLVTIDAAQKTIDALSSQVVELRQILSNKQSRGLFGQMQMEAIIRNALPPTAFAFQATLSNRSRPDCLIRFPNSPSLVIDSKFPLEAWKALRAANTPEAAKTASAQLRRDITTHIKAMGENYFIPGETQSTALMFIASDSVHADLSENFEDVVQEGYRRGIMIVSPALLMLAIQAIQSVLKDAQVREQAHVIRSEVGKLIQDVQRLGDRVEKLRTHFGQANADIDQILISTGKIASRGEKIQGLELGESEDTPEPALDFEEDRTAELPFRTKSG